VAQAKPHTPDTAVADASRAKALLEDRSDGVGRFVVQVGRVRGCGTARQHALQGREARDEDLHAVRRHERGQAHPLVRVGPFASRDEADKAAARIKSAGFGPQVIAL
jgi:DedD protein